MQLIKKVSMISVVVFAIVGCKTNPHKAIEAETAIKNQESVGGGVTLGQNDKGEVVTQRKQRLADQLRDLQSNVYQLESDIYGHEEYGRKGLFGVLKECLDSNPSGELKRLPSRTVLTKGEDKFNGRMVIDENKNLVNVSDEYFLDRIKRFEDYRERYEKQKDDFEDRVRICQASQKKSI